ncbi:PASTA domain-containing protein [Paenibacillus sp. MER TA 81-3]|uniref:PASTA domain-containing protein n=1 Tax=Paenibacillus sp. MER TA 81-3 TaxID=2939573 RepID=UPI00203F9A38|nr:PASTA domain-containing protein [Paenibacillus sp. MER TA 81-3]MCM3342179.1 PASTA domain-containing protein [Paenibacillus sp. MER TA 81-3]
MSAYIGERYELCKVILHLADGVLYEAIDLSLKRDVFIYLVENTGTGKAEESKRAFGKVSHFSNNRFFHMLNAGTSGQNFFVVFSAYTGMPLVRYIQHHALSSQKMLSMVYELGKSIQDAMEEQISRFPITVENLWITEDNQIMIMNYWTEAEPGQFGTMGLCYLMYQLSTLHLNVPANYDTYESRLTAALKDLAPAQKEAVLGLVRRVYSGDSSMFSFMVTLRETMDQPNGPVLSRMQPTSAAAAPVSNLQDDDESDDDDYDDYETEEEANSPFASAESGSDKVGRSKMLLVVACAAVFVCVLGGAVLWANSISKSNETAAITDNNPSAETSENTDSTPAANGDDATETPSDEGQATNNENSDSSNQPEASTDDRTSTDNSGSKNGGQSTDSSSGTGAGDKTTGTKPDNSGAAANPDTGSGTDTGTDANPDTTPGTTPETTPGTTPDTTTPGTTPDGGETGTATDSSGQPVAEGQVPSLVGLTKEEAEKAVLAAGLRYSFVLENNEEQAPGQVFKQEPEAGAAAKKGDRVNFYISREKK